MTTRRSFLAGLLAAAAAPAFVRSESLMGLWIPKPLWVPATNFDEFALCTGDTLRLSWDFGSAGGDKTILRVFRIGDEGKTFEVPLNRGASLQLPIDATGLYRVEKMA